MEESKKNPKQTQGELYEEMPVEEEVLHTNLQSNPLFLPASLIAGMIYYSGIGKSVVFRRKE
jgi:hypothetical protein